MKQLRQTVSISGALHVKSGGRRSMIARIDNHKVVFELDFSFAADKPERLMLTEKTLEKLLAAIRSNRRPKPRKEQEA